MACAGYTPPVGVRSPFGARVPDRVHLLVAGSIEANAVPTAYITHPSFLLHDMGPYHPECPDRLSAIGDRLISAGLDPYLRHYSAPAATDEQLGRVHSRDYIALIEAESSGDRASLPRSRHGDESALARRRAARSRRCGAGNRPRAVRRMPQRVLRGASAGTPCGARPGDGILPVQQRRRRRRARAGARPRTRGGRRFRRPSRQRHRSDVHPRSARADDLDVPAPAVSVLRARQSGAEHGQHPAVRRHRRQGIPRGGDRALDAGARAPPARDAVHLGGLRRASRGSARRARSSSKTITHGSLGK